jgi:hypothetical protein
MAAEADALSRLKFDNFKSSLSSSVDALPDFYRGFQRSVVGAIFRSNAIAKKWTKQSAAMQRAISARRGEHPDSLVVD